MSLAARLDRLRGQATPQPDDGEALAARLHRARRGVSAGGAGAAKGAGKRSLPLLAAALGAQQAGDGLLWCERKVRLPSVAARAAGLATLPEVCDLPGGDWVYIDTETTGLSGGVGNLAFMIGVARHVASDLLVVRHYVLGSFAGESTMLRDLLGWIGDAAVLVSYNGKCFDLPLLVARLRMHRISGRLGELRHLDLMYGVRRAYRRYWPDCRLQTAEQRLLGLYRDNDLPGSEAPAAWRAWLENGSSAALRRTLEHNHQDVVSLALLHRRLVEDHTGRVGGERDHAAIAMAWCGAGRQAEARALLEGALDALDDRGHLQLARIYRQQGEWASAEAIWLELYRRGNAAAAVELSKYYEHRRRDYRKAFGYAKECEPGEREPRVARLQSKIGRNLALPW